MISRRTFVGAALSAGAALSPGLAAVGLQDDWADEADWAWSDWRNLVYAPEDYAPSWCAVRDVMFCGRPRAQAAAEAIEAELAPKGDVGDFADAIWQAWQELPPCERTAVIVQSMGELDMWHLTISDDNASDVGKVFAIVARRMAARMFG